MKYQLTLILAGILLIFTGCSESKQDTQQASPSEEEQKIPLDFNRPVHFLSSSGNDTLVTLHTALADNDRERSQGLMDINNLPEDNGMLFIFEENKPRGFWMANTPLPLDIIFVNTEKVIVRIYHNTKPYSKDSLTSDKPAQYVIETNAGYTVTHDIREGMSVAF